MPLAFALSNEGGNDNTERLVPEEDRQPLWVRFFFFFFSK